MVMQNKKEKNSVETPSKDIKWNLQQVKVVRWGHLVYANIQKFIQFQLTVNVAALAINFVAAVSSGNVSLNVDQLLWVNPIMDTLGALALATEPPTDHLMHRPPVGHRGWTRVCACIQLRLKAFGNWSRVGWSSITRCLVFKFNS
eukprot:Gb_24541 [translate_table: standard]